MWSVRFGWGARMGDAWNWGGGVRVVVRIGERVSPRMRIDSSHRYNC